MEDGSKCLARLLPSDGNSGEAAEQLASAYKQMSHPVIPDYEFRKAEGKSVLMLEYSQPTLLDVFQKCVRGNLPGVPRKDLLGIVAHTASALDELAEDYDLAHLALNPTSILMQGKEFVFTDFGLMQLYWLALGGSPIELNSRYSAPEMLAGHTTGTSDQFSLATIYTEMLTGFHPLPQKRLNRRQKSSKADLTFLSSKDQHAVAKALDPDPAKRFASCREFVEALGVRYKYRRFDMLHSVELPPVVHVGKLTSRDITTEQPLPDQQTYLRDFMFRVTEMRCFHASKNCRYHQFQDDRLQTHIPVELEKEEVSARIESFAEQWKARVFRQAENTYRLLIRQKAGIWKRLVGGEQGIELAIELQPGTRQPNMLLGAQVVVREMRAAGSGGVSAAKTLGPEILNSVCSHLQATRENRNSSRLPLLQQLTIFPVVSEQQIGKPVVGDGRDFSLSGVNLFLPDKLAVDYVYIVLEDAEDPNTMALLANVRRIKQLDNGFETGLKFVKRPVTISGERTSDADSGRLKDSSPSSIFELMVSF